MAFLKDKHKSIKKGEDHYKPGHVEKYSQSDGQFTGLVRAMRDKVYPVSVSLKKTCFILLSTFYREELLYQLHSAFGKYSDLLTFSTFFNITALF